MPLSVTPTVLAACAHKGAPADSLEHPAAHLLLRVMYDLLQPADSSSTTLVFPSTVSLTPLPRLKMARIGGQ